jgi:hypothetical protein
MDSLYGAYYYRVGCGSPYVRNEGWLGFFAKIAARVVADIHPASVLDAGCAMGFLVEGLRSLGVEAYGIDVSQHAIEQIHENIKPYCAIASVTDPLPRRYDLIVCIEVLEHLQEVDAERAVSSFCEATDQVLFSSTPFDYVEATHFNVRPPDYWAGLFARHSFYRDLDFDGSFLTPWAVLFRKTWQPAHRLVTQYERRLWLLLQEINGSRELTLKQHAELDQLESRLAEATTQLDAARHDKSNLEQALAEKQQALAAKEQALMEKEEALAARDQALAERDQALAARDREFDERLSRQTKEYLARLAECERVLAEQERAWCERLRAYEQALAEQKVDKERALTEMAQAHAERTAAEKAAAQKRETALGELLRQRQAESEAHAAQLQAQAATVEALNAQLAALQHAHAACTSSRAWKAAHILRQWRLRLASLGGWAASATTTGST